MTDPRTTNIPDPGKDDKVEETYVDSGFCSSGNIVYSGEVESQEYDEVGEEEVAKEAEESKKTTTSMLLSDSGLCLSKELSLSEKLSTLNLDHNDLDNPPVRKEAEEEEPWSVYFEQDEDGDTHLHVAILRGLVKVALALIRAAPHKGLLDTPNDAGQSPLHLAVLTRQFYVARWLIIAGARPCPRDSQGDSPLHIAVRNGDINSVKAITEAVTDKQRDMMVLPSVPRTYEKVKLDQWNYLGQTCLHTAAKLRHLDILEHLVKCGGNINAQEGLTGLTPLHYAVENCDEKMVKYLLTECASLNPEVRCYAGRNAWQWCRIVPEKLSMFLRSKGLDSPYSTDEDSTDSDEEMPFDDKRQLLVGASA